MDPSASTVAAVGVQQEVFDFGRISAQGAVQDFGVDVEKYSADEQRLLSDLNVAEAYFAVFAARSVLQASEDAYQRARVHRDLAKAKVAGGLRPPIDLTRTEADLTRFDVGRIRARGGLDAAQINFAAAVGLPQQKLDAKGEPPPPFDVPSLAEALVQWAKSDPILQAALARLRAQQAATRAIQAELRPNLALSATFSGREGGAPPASGDVGEHEGSLPAVPNWDVGLILRWPLYDGVVLARRDASLQREQVRKAELDLVKQQQVAAIGQAHVNVTVTRAALAALEHALEAAKANYDQADARFKAGLANTVELADAEAVRTEAEIQLALGRLEVARARAELGRLIAEGP
jgi:outer membrane protein